MNRAVELIRSEHVASVLTEVLEGMAFTGACPADAAAADWPAESPVWARVELVAPAVGDMIVVAEQEDMLNLVDAVWGGVIETTAAAACALMEELANAIAGQVLANLDAQSEVRLGLPESGLGTLPSESMESVQHAFLLDDGAPMRVVVRALA